MTNNFWCDFCQKWRNSHLAAYCDQCNTLHCTECTIDHEDEEGNLIKTLCFECQEKEKE